MSGPLTVGIVGDYDPDKPSHPFTTDAVVHAADHLGIRVETKWLHTTEFENDPEAVLKPYKAVWCAPGGPYASLEGALSAIRVCREEDRPFFGT